MSSAARVLVVDDDESIREFLVMALADEGFEVITAAHGAAALELLEQSPPDLILLDIRMPVMDGWAFLRAYRERPGPHRPVVVVTAAREVAERMGQIEVAGYLAKPFDLDDLIEVVRRTTATTGQADAARLTAPPKTTTEPPCQA